MTFDGRFTASTRSHTIISINARCRLTRILSARTSIHDISLSLSPRCTEAVELLNENGGDINREDSFGLNPLYLANNSVNGEETFRYLLTMGARFNLVSQEKMLEEGKHVPDEARALEEEKVQTDGADNQADAADDNNKQSEVPKEDDFVNV